MRSKWCDCEILGIMFARRCDCRKADFSGAKLTNVEYQYTDFRGATFCECLMRIGSTYGAGSRFDESMFKEMTV